MRGLALRVVVITACLLMAANAVSFPPSFTLELLVPNLPSGSYNNMTVAWDSQNNRAAIWNYEQLAPGSTLLDVSVAPPPQGADRIVFMGYESVAGDHSTDTCCFHNITAAPLHPFWTPGNVVQATSCYGHTGLTCYNGTAARYAPASVQVWCFDQNANPICTVSLISPFPAIWQVFSTSNNVPDPSWFNFPNDFGSCTTNCDAPSTTTDTNTVSSGSSAAGPVASNSVAHTASTAAHHSSLAVSSHAGHAQTSHGGHAQSSTTGQTQSTHGGSSHTGVAQSNGRTAVVQSANTNTGHAQSSNGGHASHTGNNAQSSFTGVAHSSHGGNTHTGRAVAASAGASGPAVSQSANTHSGAALAAHGGHAASASTASDDDRVRRH